MFDYCVHLEEYKFSQLQVFDNAFTDTKHTGIVEHMGTKSVVGSDMV